MDSISGLLLYLNIWKIHADLGSILFYKLSIMSESFLMESVSTANRIAAAYDVRLKTVMHSEQRKLLFNHKY